MRVALLSNVTINLIADCLKQYYEIYIPSGFDTWQQEIYLTESGLYNFHPESIVVLLYADAYQDIWNDKTNGDSLISEWIGALKILSEHLPNIPLFVSSIHILHEKNCYYAAEKTLNLYFESLMEQQIRELHNNGMNVYVLPVNDIVYEIGSKNFYSPKMWYMGSMPYSIKGIECLSELIIQYLSTQKDNRKKCIAVDLDNTLWGGVIGEDGVENILLSNCKEGEIYKNVQRLLKQMKKQGVMLAILSKNNPEDVEPVFLHQDMLLQHDDFVAEIINWDSKPENIKKLAKDLNIGLDTFVFLDDNPLEREQMKTECPEVTVVEFPKDISKLPRIITEIYHQYFFRLDVTSEDENKTSMYQAETKRKSEFAKSVSPEEFLSNLQMKIDIHLMKSEEIKRVVQLIHKTNQFNTTSKRYTIDEVSEFYMQKNTDIITVYMSDKYGNQGLVSVLIINFNEENAYIDTFLMSCRVMGRKAEVEIMAALKKYLKNKSVKYVFASYIKSTKNAPVSHLYDSLGFSLIDQSQDSGEICDYKIKVENLPDTTGFFERKGIT